MTEHFRGKKIKWKGILPVIVFVIGICIVYKIVSYNDQTYQEQKRMKAELNAVNYAQEMMADIQEGISITEIMEQVVTSWNGDVDYFSALAANLANENVQSIKIAPEGIVTNIYPEEDSEDWQIDLINDEKYRKITQYGIDHDMVVIQGPIDLKQGGKGIAIRNPVFLEDADGKKKFWGLTIAIIRVPDVFEDSIRKLTKFGYDYKLSKTSSPLSFEYEEIDSSGRTLEQPIVYLFDQGGCSWKLEVMPTDGWKISRSSRVIIFSGGCIVLLLTVLITVLLGLAESRNKLKKLSDTDPLTGLLNRKGFDEQVDRYMKKHPQENCVCVALDIDDFKFINDLYGHSCGDRVLQQMAESMREMFPQNSVLGRNGGDEFCMILKNCTCKDVEDKIGQFTQMQRSFCYGGREYEVGISVGYAEAPVFTGNRADILRKADNALYEVKLKGKHGCLAYTNNLQTDKRTQLGFALNDISDYLPEAFLICKADRDNDQILFSSAEMIRLAGCSDIDDFLVYTGQSFRNLVVADKREVVVQTVMEQAVSKEPGVIVDTAFQLQRKDGIIESVEALGRLVENQYYGRVFYVVISKKM